MSELDPTTIKVLGTVITAMVGAIGIQWKTTMGHLSRVESKLDECEKDREQLWRTIATQCGKPVDELRAVK